MERKKTYLARVSGLVQGVGFRPFVYRLAHECGLKGWVNNTNEYVQVAVNARPEELEDFIGRIRVQSPPAARIDSVEYSEIEWEDFTDFRILESESLSGAVTRVSPDIAVCEDCLDDMKRQPNRVDYPFLNCTNCGPRFTIVCDLPYDRRNTTMRDFKMCPSCRKEYGDVTDRRFHAQPTACRDCGPAYTLAENKQSAAGDVQAGADPDIVNRTARLIDGGKIVAVKGMGGFFMACDALNRKAVRRLRESKLREGKPFAVMFRDIDAVREFCAMGPVEQAELESWRKPIVILQNRMEGNGREGTDRPDDHGGERGKLIAPSVSNGFPTTGGMLPYMPFHYLLFERLKTPAIVMTSGNLAEEPIIINNGQAELILGPVSDAVLHYNRDIHNRCDDSVLMVAGDHTRVIRRSRGYVPDPVRLGLDAEGIFAAGAELVNCFAMGKGTQAILSQHIGDLKNFETFEFYRETYERFKRLFRLEPVLVTHDLHPDYLSTRFAGDLGLPTVGVQHHHAHIASVLAEHGLDEKVIGVSFDGTGLGDDGNIWGSEFLVCDLEYYERIAHLEYLPMPGGDRATYEPWRMAVSLLYSRYGREFTGLRLPFLERIDPSTLELVIQSIEKGINCPKSSGAGRYFDAVSAMLGICTTSLFHAEAPMRLEAAIRPEEGIYTFGPGDPGKAEGKGGHANETKVIRTAWLAEAIVEDILGGVESGKVSARFHNTMAAVILETVRRTGSDRGIRKVALSGGTFQNRYLSERIEGMLRENGFEVLVPIQLPANDGGIALGQLAVAAKRRTKGIL